MRPSAPPDEARTRPTKTRGKNLRLSSRPAVVLSALRVTSYDLTHGMEHMKCPDCRTWVPMTGMLSTPRLVPHHTEPAGTVGPTRRCISSNRLITLDVTLADWRRILHEGVSEAGSRRATQVTFKPRVAPAPPVGGMGAARLAPRADRDRPRRRAAEWSRVAQAVADVDDARRAQLPAGAASAEYDVPLDPPRITRA